MQKASQLQRNKPFPVFFQAAQLKHCAKHVQDILLPLIKNLEAAALLALVYRLMTLMVVALLLLVSQWLQRGDAPVSSD